MVSVIIPAYNSAPWLGECLDSVLSQNPITLWEAIIVDDGSTDSTPEIAQKYASLYRNIHLISQTNQGLAQARNVGVSECSGDYVTFLDADDKLMPNALKRLAETIGEADVCTGAIKESVTTPVTADLKEVLYKSGNLGSACGKLYKREVFDKVKFQPGLYYEDLDFVFRLYSMTPKIAVLKGDPVYFYRKTPNSILERFDPRRMDVLKVTEAMEEEAIGVDPLLYKAARNRRFAANFYVLMLLEKHQVPGYEALKRECFQLIKRYRNEVLWDKNSRFKLRLGALSSLLGRKFLKALAPHYNSR